MLAAIQPFTGASICAQLRPSASLNLPVALTVVPFGRESICSKPLPAPLLTAAFWLVPVSTVLFVPPVTLSLPVLKIEI